MTTDLLDPRLDLLSEQYVLVQAWKKTAAYIRYHNWFADTLALDRAAVNLPHFLEGLAERLQEPECWSNTPMRIVPAPKSQEWRVNEIGRWGPRPKEEIAKKMRPLAHVVLEDQVAATALMMCLADRVETLQGDPTLSIDEPQNLSVVTSYGNRLFCGKVGGVLQHRWGSAKLYRSFFQDYQQFLARAEIVAEHLSADTKVVIIHSDLKNFYDRVSPDLLAEKITALQNQNDDPRFFQIARRILCWEWDTRDINEVMGYASKAELDDFSKVALPQGLVSAGFFSNIVLLEFDRALRSHLGSLIYPGIVLHDVCRYVDDIRLVLSVEGFSDLIEIEKVIFAWLQEILDSSTTGLKVSSEKTRAVLFRGDERPLVRQGRKMRRIQQAISGGFDAIEGGEILDAVRALVRTQQHYSEKRLQGQGWRLTPIPDVRDDTVARFAAARFRSTFRSLRPLLDSQEDLSAVGGEIDSQPRESNYLRKTQEDLDDDARAFALGLIENWVEDPSNVRLLRVGLDLWPDVVVLTRILEILRQYTSSGGGRKAPRRVAWYCLSEIFRAGATETGFVDDDERLPDKIDIHAYRSALFAEAVQLLSLPATLPWYLKQQIFLFLAAFNPTKVPLMRRGRNLEIKHYRDLLRYLKGETRGLLDRDFATLAIISRRAFLDKSRATQLANDNISANRAKLIAERDPAFGLELFDLNPEIVRLVPQRLQHDLCVGRQHPDEGTSLADLVLNGTGILRNELILLQFAEKFLESLREQSVSDVIAPYDVQIQIIHDSVDPEKISLGEVKIRLSRTPSPNESIYSPPTWCQPEERWRFQLGYLMRFILTEHIDFTQPVRKISWKEDTSIYRRLLPHWLQRTYGFYSGHSAYGADWLPISDWTEQFLYALLAWPGCMSSEFSGWITGGIEVTLRCVRERICLLLGFKGRISETLILPLSSSWPYKKPKTARSLRACVVQTVIPGPDHFFTPVDLVCKTIRKKHRNHLSAALAAVVKMLHLRATHKGSDGQLDLLILPELSVHPLDVETHLVPFARAYKTIILAGLTYEEISKGGLLANAALWVIPAWSPVRGLEIIRRKQGKKHLARDEQNHNNLIPTIEGFRPCQWLVGYEWNPVGESIPLNMTASVCYDATDIRLAADLQKLSDVFIIPALNKDVKTFDQMALALHYHMYQMVIVANNGTYGGSNAYAPYDSQFERQIFHLHGQPQASIGFLEIDNIGDFLNRRHEHNNSLIAGNTPKWKCPPAGMVSEP